MDWSTVFAAVNLLAMVAWAALILAPRPPVVLAGVLYIGVGILCLVYAVSLIGVVAGVFPNNRGSALNINIEAVRGFFGSDAGVTIGWTHYLAFDLFVGLWIARDADAKGFSRWLQAPVLLATFLVGPIGLLVWLGVRERRARSVGRWN
ncbi:MAG: ABA4-like family protein [Pseudomonadota bacterium]